jgi:hypothetical protein
MTDASLDGWRSALATLGNQLVDFESNPTVELARTGCLSGGSASAWDTADAGVSKAWETYRAMDDLLQQVTATPGQAGALLSSSTVPGPDGPTDPTTAMRAAKAAVEAAVEVAAKLSAAFEDLGPRAQAAREAANVAGDEATARAADSLAKLLASDPLAVSVADVKGVEAAAAQATGRHSAAQAAAARLDIDLTTARNTLTGLRSDLAGAAAEIDHAVSRIAGLDQAHPVPDLDQLGDWLDRIDATAAHDPPRSAGNLASWVAAADARRTELDAALEAARSAMRRRDEGRGLWTALRAKAAARHLDEQQDVAAALRSAREQLWQAPCDLTAAEAALSKLSALLRNARGGPS